MVDMEWGLTSTEIVTFLFDPANDSGFPLITTCPAANPFGKASDGKPLETSTETVPNKPSRMTTMDSTLLPIDMKKRTSRN